jgi:hypothetical protein
MAVVGESCYQEALLGFLRRTGRSMVATVEPEPTNPHDANAVVIKIEGEVVGYLSRNHAKRFQPALLAHAVSVRCPCELHGGTADKLSIGVVLDFVQVYALAEAAGIA